MRNNFDIISWCKLNNVLIRLPGESRLEYSSRINIASKSQISPASYHSNSPEEVHNQQYEWKDIAEFEHEVIEFLRITKNYQLRGKLWSDTVGRLAFVVEETIAEKTYLKLAADKIVC